MVLKELKKNIQKNPVNWRNDGGILYDQYGFNSTGFNKDGYDIYGFDIDGFNKDGDNINGFNKDGLNKDELNKFGYKKKSGKVLNVSALPILLSKIYTNNSSKELINDIKQLVKNLYKNKQISKQVSNILHKALYYKEFIK